MSQLSLKYKILLSVLYTALCVSAGRFLGPEKVKIQKEVVKTDTNIEHKEDKVKVNTDRVNHLKKVIVENVKPDGSKQITTTFTNDSDTKKTTVSDSKLSDVDKKTEDAKESKEITRGGSRTNIAALGLINPLALTDGITYGLHVQKEILGPITIGVPVLFGQHFSVGLSGGLSF